MRGSTLVQIVIKLRNDLPLANNSQSEGRFFATDVIGSGQSGTATEIKIRRLFTSLTYSEINDLVSRAKGLDERYEAPKFSKYYVIDCPQGTNAKALLQNLLANNIVELGYVVDDSTPPHASNEDQSILSPLQGYLAPAPTGIDAEYAWRVKGGNGDGSIRFVDIEQGWILDHESLEVDTLPCTGLNYAFHDHGAAVLGIAVMKQNDNKGSGITPNVKSYVVSQWRPDGHLNNPDAIMAALSHLSFGDIILIQAQVRGLSAGKRLWPVEVHAANFDVIRLATALGVIVVEAAANGSIYFNLSSDLDQFSLDGKMVLNRLNADFRDSGAIMVAAATAGVPHRRIYNSNFGSRIDCYAWGEKVYTAGAFPNVSNGAVDRYTNQFGGTSSAAAIITGVALSLQSMMEANYNIRLGPAEMREILTSELYGTQSENGRSIDKIGVMPDLKKIVDKIFIDNIDKSRFVNE